MTKKKKKNNGVDITCIGLSVIDNGSSYKILGLDFDKKTKKTYFRCLLTESYNCLGYLNPKEFHRIAIDSKALETASIYSYWNGLIPAYDPSGKIKPHDFVNFTGSANKINIGEYPLGCLPEIRKNKKSSEHQGIVIEKDTKTKKLLYILKRYN